jgi:hypothetical protein
MTMLMLRRTFLKGFAALVGVLVGPQAAPAAPRPVPVEPEGLSAEVVLPDWCPAGWVPCAGQEINHKQFPRLFYDSVRPNGRRFVARYKGKFVAQLPYEIHWPEERRDIERYGYMDRFTQVIRPDMDNRVRISIMATEPQRWANGRWAAPGFLMELILMPEQVLDHYPSIPPGANEAQYKKQQQNRMSSWIKYT